MSYGTMVRRLNKDETRAVRVTERPSIPATPVRDGQTPTDIVLAGLYEPVRRPRRRSA
jgi:hypothetical protein